jgi:hypothetical protein
MGLNELVGDGMRSLLTKGADRKASQAVDATTTASSAIQTADSSAISKTASAATADLAKVQNDIAQGLPVNSQYHVLSNLTVSDVKAIPWAADPQKVAYSFEATLNYDGRNDLGDMGRQADPITGIYDPAMRDGMWTPQDLSGQTPSPFYRLLSNDS